MSHRIAFVATVATTAVMAAVLPAAGGSKEAAASLEIVSVRATTRPALLSPTETNVVVARPTLGFRIAVRNAGRAAQRSVRLTVTVQQVRPTRRIVTVGTLAPGASKSVVARSFGRVAFAQKLKLRVTARTPMVVSSRVYTVIFALPPP